MIYRPVDTDFGRLFYCDYLHPEKPMITSALGVIADQFIRTFYCANSNDLMNSPQIPSNQSTNFNISPGWRPRAFHEPPHSSDRQHCWIGSNSGGCFSIRRTEPFVSADRAPEFPCWVFFNAIDSRGWYYFHGCTTARLVALYSHWLPASPTYNKKEKPAHPPANLWRELRPGEVAQAGDEVTFDRCDRTPLSWIPVSLDVGCVVDPLSAGDVRNPRPLSRWRRRIGVPAAMSPGGCGGHGPGSNGTMRDEPVKPTGLFELENVRLKEEAIRLINDLKVRTETSMTESKLDASRIKYAEQENDRLRNEIGRLRDELAQGQKTTAQLQEDLACEKVWTQAAVQGRQEQSNLVEALNSIARAQAERIRQFEAAQEKWHALWYALKKFSDLLYLIPVFIPQAAVKLISDLWLPVRGAFLACTAPAKDRE